MKKKKIVSKIFRSINGRSDELKRSIVSSKKKEKLFILNYSQAHKLQIARLPDNHSPIDNLYSRNHTSIHNQVWNGLFNGFATWNTCKFLFLNLFQLVLLIYSRFSTYPISFEISSRQTRERVCSLLIEPTICNFISFRELVWNSIRVFPILYVKIIWPIRFVKFSKTYIYI